MNQTTVLSSKNKEFFDMHNFHKIILGVFLMAISSTLSARGSDQSKPDYVKSFLSEKHFQKIKSGNLPSKLYPEFSDRKAWEEIKSKKMLKKMVDEIMSGADKVPAPEFIPHSLYREFATIGNRTNFEGKYFERRRNFALLVLGMCISGDKEKYLPAVVDYIQAIMEESSWCLPAHRKWKGQKLLETEVCDLSAAETAADLALAMLLIGKELDDYPGLVEKIRSRVLKNVYLPLLPESRIFHNWTQRKAPNNWMPWCSYNLTLSAVCMETNPGKLAFALQEYMKYVSQFADFYSDDGFCEEGSSYYYVSGGMMFNFSMLLEKILPGSMKKFYAYPKNRAIFEYIANVTIGNDTVSFADAKRSGKPNYRVLHLSSMMLDSPVLKNMAVRFQDFENSLDDVSLTRHLPLLFDLKEENLSAWKKSYNDTYFPGNLAILRSEKFSASLKAGHNAQSHNHSDLGHFTLYSGNTPVIIDAGCSRYQRANFSELRYTLWYIRGTGHNAPVFNGIEQIKGEQYVSKLSEIEKISDTQKRLTIDLSKAYPKTAGVKKFLRTLDYEKDSLTVTDDFQLKSPLPAEINLLTIQKPVSNAPQQITLGNVELQLDGISFVNFERVSDEEFEKYSKWDTPIYRIVLKTDKNRYQMKFSTKK